MPGHPRAHVQPSVWGRTHAHRPPPPFTTTVWSKSVPAGPVAGLISAVVCSGTRQPGRTVAGWGGAPVSEDNELNCSVPISREILCNQW